MTRLQTRVTEILDIEHPILAAPMAKITGGRLAAAVSNAGGLGLIGGGYCDPTWVEAAFHNAGNARVGVGFITWALDERPEALDVALERKPAAVMLSFGDPKPYVRKVKDTGAKLLCQVQTLREAREAAEYGADIVIAQGHEGGGHGRVGRGTFGLVRAAVEAVSPIPVIAAGGIADGNGLAAALMLGADGILMGTRFFASQEATAPDVVKNALCAGEGDDVVFTGVFDKVRGPNWPMPYSGHAIKNKLSERWRNREKELAGAALEKERNAYKLADESNDLNTKVVWAGEIIDVIDNIEDARTIVDRTIVEAVNTLSAAGKWIVR